MVKKTKKKVRGANTKPDVKTKSDVKTTQAKARTAPAKKLARQAKAATRPVKKAVLQINVPQPKETRRADLAPTNGFSLVVDGQIKAHFDREGAAKKAAKELLASYPMLKVEIHDASTRHRTLISN